MKKLSAQLYFFTQPKTILLTQKRILTKRSIIQKDNKSNTHKTLSNMATVIQNTTPNNRTHKKEITHKAPISTDKKRQPKHQQIRDNNSH